MPIFFLRSIIGKINQGPGARYVKGVFKADEKLIFLLDLDQILTHDEQVWLKEIQVS